jgi:hypothetical protein
MEKQVMFLDRRRRCSKFHMRRLDRIVSLSLSLSLSLSSIKLCVRHVALTSSQPDAVMLNTSQPSCHEKGVDDQERERYKITGLLFKCTAGEKHENVKRGAK